jgi:ATP-binding cassette subfamily A (ABC1) protein 1
MAEGQLRCLGSSLFLKKTYGVGYQLTIEKQPRTSKATPLALKGDGDGEKGGLVSTADDIYDKLTGIVDGSVPEATLLTNVGTEMSFQLPLGAASRFAPMFEQLDAEIDNGGIVTYGVGVTTLDEVFLLVARGGDASPDKKDYASSKRLNGVAMKDDAEKSVRSRMDLENEGLFVRHVGALFTKRAMNFKRDKKAWICTTILPSLFVFLGFIIFTFAGAPTSFDPLTLDLDDLNVNVKKAPRNPIPFNSGDTYSCQPGKCIYDIPIVDSNVTGESYAYCGYQSYLGNETSCSIEDYEPIMARITEAGAEPVGDAVDNVTEVREVRIVSKCYRSQT